MFESINWSDPAVMAALIESVGGIAGAAVAALCAALIGGQIAKRKRLEEKLRAAEGDIAFLLEVEAQHCSIHKAETGESRKIKVRRAVEEKGLTWTGRFTPGRVKASLVTREPAIEKIIRERDSQRDPKSVTA